MAIKLGKLILNAQPAKPAEPAPISESPAESPAPTAAPAGPKPGIRLGGFKLAAPAAAPDNVADGSGAGDSTEVAESAIARGTPEGFQALLDRLDGLIIEGQGVSVLTLDTARHYVKDIYTELAQFPEFDPIFKDRDMHNVMSFVQRSTIQAKEVVAKKQVKAETRAAKKIETAFGDFGSFTDPVAKPVTTQIAAAAAVGNAMAAMQRVDTSGIEAKERGKK